MKRLTFRIWLALILAVMMISLCLPAYAGVFDPDTPLTLTLHVLSDSDPVVGMEYSIYRVADAYNFPTMTLTPEFENYPVSLALIETNEEWAALAETLAAYVESDNLTPYDTGETDSTGVIEFPKTKSELEDGLYLVIGETIQIDRRVHRMAPYFVVVPYVDETTGEPVYDVESIVKIETEILPEVVDRRVIKVWNDQGYYSRPAYVDVVLLRDGEPYETVRLSAENNWRHDWTDLLAEYRWSLIEHVPSGYTVLIRLQGITFVVTNTKPFYPPPPPPPPPVIVTTEPEVTTIIETFTEPETKPEPETVTVPETVYIEMEPPETPDIEDPPSPSELPQTGMLQWPVPLLGAAGLASTIFGVIKIKNRDDE